MWWERPAGPESDIICHSPPSLSWLGGHYQHAGQRDHERNCAEKHEAGAAEAEPEQAD